MRIGIIFTSLASANAFTAHLSKTAFHKITSSLNAVDHNGMPIFEYPSISPPVETTPPVPTNLPAEVVPVAAAPSPVSPTSAISNTGSSDPISALDASQQAIVDKIASAIPDLALKPDLSWGPNDGITIGGNSAFLDGRDAAGASNVAWLANVKVENKLSSLTIFNGPLTSVPHLLSRCIINDDGTMSFALDFRPRAYGAYEMVDAQGNYPGPDVLGRNAFTYSGNRKEFETNFGTLECVAFIESAVASFQGGVVSTDYNEYELLTKGPLSVKVTMPLTSENVQAVIAARETAANYWLTWALEKTHNHRPGAPVNSQYVYDTKYRQNAYAALLPIYNAALGPDGANLAMAESGPLDEAYVGGGS
jgi:hypothetical protein